MLREDGERFLPWMADPVVNYEHLHRYRAVADDGAAHQVSEESLDVRWWPVDALPELEDEMRTLIRLARDRM